MNFYRFSDIATGSLINISFSLYIINGKWPFSSIICEIYLCIDYTGKCAAFYFVYALKKETIWSLNKKYQMPRWPILFWFQLTDTSQVSPSTFYLCMNFHHTVTRPFTYRQKRTRKKAIFAICLAWFVSALIWCPAILLWPRMFGREFSLRVKQ